MNRGYQTYSEYDQNPSVAPDLETTVVLQNLLDSSVHSVAMQAQAVDPSLATENGASYDLYQNTEVSQASANVQQLEQTITTKAIQVPRLPEDQYMQDNTLYTTNPVEPKPDNLELNAGYHLERQDEKHRMGDILVELQNHHKNNSSIHLGFWDWVNSLSYFEAYGILKQQRSTVFARNLAGPFLTGVRYMDSIARQKHVVSFEAGRLYTPVGAFDTSNLETVFSGKGWAMWVRSVDDIFYSASHIKGRSHHSSFLEGRDVKAAGEWLVVDGELKCITGKSGHYRGDMDHLVGTLFHFEKLGVNVNLVDVIVWKRQQATMMRANDLMRMMDRSQLSAIGAAPLTKKPPRERGTDFVLGRHRGAH